MTRAPMPARVLITGINYWPERTGNAPYTTGLAEHLAGRGMAVDVVTAMPYYPTWQSDPEYAGHARLVETREGVTVRRFRTYIPDRQTAARRIAFETSFFAHALLRRDARPDLVLGIVPSLSGGGLAAFAARRSGVPLGLIFQDLVGGAARQSGMPGGARVAAATRAIEGAIARRAAAVAIVSEGFRGYLEALGVAPERIVRVRNWTHLAPARRDRAEVRRELGWADDDVVVLHSGAMGLKQGLENVIATATLAKHRAARLRFVLIGDGSQKAHLQRLAGVAGAAGAAGTVAFLPPQPDDRFADTLAAADVLLVNERASLLDMALPSKLTSYFAAGRPVVAAVAPRGWTAKEIEGSGGGIVAPAEDPPALLAAIERIAADPALAARLGEAGRTYARTTLDRTSILCQADTFVDDLLRARTVPRPDGAENAS